MSNKSLIGNLKTVVVGGDTDNPHYAPEYAGVVGNPATIAVSYNARESPAALWLRGRKGKAGSIDGAQYKAATDFRRVWEIASGALNQGFDYTAERVDTSGRSEPISLMKAQAVSQLASWKREFSPEEYWILGKACGECLFLSVLFSKDHTQRRWAKICRDALDRLAIMQGYKS